MTGTVFSIGDHLKVVGLSDVGCVRTLNEDNFLVDHKLGLLVVADGMGGHDAGEVASARVIESVQDYLHRRSRAIDDDDEDSITLSISDTGRDPLSEAYDQGLVATVRAAVAHANAVVNQLNKERGFNEGSGMGATLVGCWIPDGPGPGIDQDREVNTLRPLVFHVGDSRLYLMRNGRLIPITRDHSMYQQWVDFGGRGTPPAQNIILQAMGPAANVSPDIVFQDLEPGDAILMCSDGLSGMIPDDEIAEMIQGVTEQTISDVATRLIDQAKENGGKDNVTVILGVMVP